MLDNTPCIINKDIFKVFSFINYGVNCGQPNCSIQDK